MAEQKESKYFEISVIEVLKLFLKRWFYIVIAGVICALAMFGYKYTQIEREYKSSALVYVNSSTSSVSEVIKSISYSDIQASKSLVEVYSIIIKARTQLELVSDCLRESYGLEYDYMQLSNMITVGSVNETEVIQITAQGKNKDDVAPIANATAEVMTTKLEQIIKGASVKSVDQAQGYTSISRGTAKTTIIAGIIGAIVACGVIFLIYLFDNSIESEEWLRKTFGEEIPLLSIIPNSITDSNNKYGYKKYGYKNYYRNSTKKDGDKK